MESTHKWKDTQSGHAVSGKIPLVEVPTNGRCYNMW